MTTNLTREQREYISPEHMIQIRATALAHAVSVGVPLYEEDTLTSSQKATIIMAVASKFEKYILGTTE